MRIVFWDGGLLYIWCSILGMYGFVKDSGWYGGYGRYGVMVFFGCLRFEVLGKYFEVVISMELGVMSIFGGV